MRNTRFRGIAEQLLNAGVSPRRVRRMVAELADHFEDLREEMEARGLSRQEAELEAAAKLGTGALIEGVLARPELRSWVRRWPLAAFTIVPLAMFASLFIAAMAALVIAVELAKNGLGIEFANSTGLQLFGQVFLGGVIWALPIIAAAACCAVALSRRAPAVWVVVGVALISLIGALTNAQIELPPVVPKAAFGAGIGFSTKSLLLPITRAACTLTAVLPAYFWFRGVQKRASSCLSA